MNLQSKFANAASRNIGENFQALGIRGMETGHWTIRADKLIHNQ